MSSTFIFRAKLDANDIATPDFQHSYLPQASAPTRLEIGTKREQCCGMGAAAYRGDETTVFQSPAQDHVESVPDLADLLELRRPQRYAVRVKGEGLRKRGIHGGD